MYCKGITKKGEPCIKLVRKGNKYCDVHKCCSGEYEECPICYDDMQSKVELKCGHSFCTSCLQNTHNDSCPLCRNSTNHIFRKREAGIQVLSHLMQYHTEEQIHADERILMAHDIFNATVSLHCYLFRIKEFMIHYEDKVREFSTRMNTTRYAKQIGSWRQRTGN